MSAPQFSVVIPTCRREDLLARCLESLAPGRQRLGAGWYEVIVTDDAKGRTAQAMMLEKFPWAKWKQGPSRGPAANRNNGARLATGEWICFIDDDCLADPEWLAAMAAAAKDETLDLIEGKTTIPDKSDNPFEHAVSNPTGGVYWSCNLAVRRSRFEALGGFDEDFLEAYSEDMEFAHRFHAHHFKSQFCAGALVLHPVRPMTWPAVWRRLFMIRWSALYRYKVDDGLHLTDSSAKNVVRAGTDTFMNYLRISWGDVKAWNHPYWRSRWFSFALRWLTFPIILPHYLYWVHRFHKNLCAKQMGGGPAQTDRKPA